MVRVREITVLDQPVFVADSDATCWSPTEGHKDFWDAFAADEYEPGTVKRMKRLLKPGSLFIDIGAWIGPFTLLALTLGCKVVAFEPDPAAFEQLRINTDSNPGDFVLLNAAVVPYGDPIKYALDRIDGAGLSAIEPQKLGYPEVPTMTIERLAELLPEWAIGFPETPGYVKVDVEGFETELMPTLGPWLAERKVPTQVSLHGHRIDAKALNGFKTVIWPQDNNGDVVALPFATMKPGSWA